MAKIKNGEGELTARICKELRECGAEVYPLIAGRETPDGWPDRLVVHKAFWGLLEFKGINTPISDAQRQVIRKLRFVDSARCFVVRESVSPSSDAPMLIITDETGRILAYCAAGGIALLQALKAIRYNIEKPPENG